MKTYRPSLELLETRQVPATIMQSAAIASTEADWSRVMSGFSKFDPSLGTLNSVSVTEQATAQLVGTASKLKKISDAVSVGVLLPNSTPIYVKLTAAAVASPFNVTVVGSTTATFTAGSSDLSGWIANGPATTFGAPAQALAEVTFIGKGSKIKLSADTFASVALTVTYDYTPF